jgi:hypothetical protein
MNEDREIIWINIYQMSELLDMDIGEDGMWRASIDGNKELSNLLVNMEWEKDIVVLERVNREEITDKELYDKVQRWIDIFHPKYNIDELRLYTPEEIMGYIMMKEKEWEEEDRRLYGQE